jgi:branched-chain amino acid transport system permease protein
MAFDIVASSFVQREKVRSPLGHTLIAGVSFGGIAFFSALVGILAMFHARWIIENQLTLGEALLMIFALWAGFQLAGKTRAKGVGALILQGAGAGAVAGALMSSLVLLMHFFKLRFMFIALNKDLQQMLTFDTGVSYGITVLIVGGAIFGALGALAYVMPKRVRRPLAIGLCWVGFFALFQELIQLMIQYESWDPVREAMFTWDGLRAQGALIIFVVVAMTVILWEIKRDRFYEGFAQLPPKLQNRLKTSGLTLVAVVGLILFPMVAGNFIGQVLLFIGLFVLMGMGLNLEIGLAGLLDLGFVAFYAVGAYTCALLTADSPYAIYQWVEWFPQFNFWTAMVASVVAAICVGVLFGIPVLKIRGDYLAVATLGLGEIVRVLVLSDFAQPLLAGAQGVLNVPPPYIGSIPIDDPVELYYIALAGAGVAAYFAWALENSRLGRAWTAIRDDEDVAQALGINLVKVKLLAYGLGAAFAGLAGALFATMLTSIYPHSFQLIISVNVLALIIVGGMGSLPGVVIGALVLIGLPELLREFGEYRFFFYGVAIVAVMRLRPAGLWPSAARRREMTLDEETRLAVEAQLAAEQAGGSASAVDGKGEST